MTAKLISAFVFARRAVQFLHFLNLKFHASSHFLWLNSLACVGLGQKPHCWFSHNAAHIIIAIKLEVKYIKNGHIKNYLSTRPYILGLNAGLSSFLFMV